MWMRTTALACHVAAALLVWLWCDAAAAQADFRCARNDQGEFHCWYVDENGDPWEPPPFDPDAPREGVPLDLESDMRRVYNTGTQCYGEYYSDPCETHSNSMTERGFDDFDGSAWAFGTGAFQTSHAHEDELFLEGNVYRLGYADDYFASSYSLFDVTFSVALPTLYRLDWELMGGPPGHLYVEEDGVRIFEWGYGMSLLDAEVIHLLAGRRYRLYHRLDSWEAYGRDGTDYRISLTPVPEPGTALLVAAGAMALGRRRRPGRRV